MKPTIRRTRIINGITIPVFIHNWSFFFTNLEVYEDGVIYCWENTDQEKFRRKLETGWVTVAPPDGEINIHHLGDFHIEKGVWEHDKTSFYNYVESKIEELKNIEQKGFIDPPKNYFYKEYFWKDKTNTSVYRQKTVKGDHSYFFFKTESKGEEIYYLIDLLVYADGSIVFGFFPKETEITFEQLDEYIAQEIIVSSPTKGSRVLIDHLGSFIITGNEWHVDINEKQKELDDIIAELNGKETSSDKCVEIYENYLQQPSVELKQKLRIAYENVPEHLRLYILRDMDAKDWPIRKIIYDKK